MGPRPPRIRDLLETLARRWRGLFVIGVLLVLLGALGLGAVGLFTLVGVIWFGALLLTAGVLQIAHAFRTPGLSRSVVMVLIGLLYVGLGAYVMAQPGVASAALTLVVALGIGAVALLRLWLAFELSQVSRALWPAVSGLVGLVLALLIFLRWPQSSDWVIGLLLAIELIMHGWMLIMIALAARPRG